AGFATFAKSKGGKENMGKFYFYNITALGYGKNDVKTKWGQRSLEDNWRWSNKNTVQQISEINVDANNTATYIADVNGEEQKYSVEFYMDRVPTDKVLIDSLRSERNFANYQLGLIYKEKFKESLLAAGKLESLLRSDP